MKKLAQNSKITGKLSVFPAAFNNISTFQTFSRNSMASEHHGISIFVVAIFMNHDYSNRKLHYTNTEF